MSQPFVLKLRKDTYNVIGMDDDRPTQIKFIHPKTGKETTMDTSNLGRKAGSGKNDEK